MHADRRDAVSSVFSSVHLRLDWSFMRKTLCAFFIALFLGASLQAGEPTTRQWTVDGVERSALIYAPDTAKTDPCPLIFAFHGHSVHSQQFARVNFQGAWPQ